MWSRLVKLAAKRGAPESPSMWKDIEFENRLRDQVSPCEPRVTEVPERWLVYMLCLVLTFCYFHPFA